MTIRTLSVVLLIFTAFGRAGAASGTVSGRLTDPQGQPVSGAKLRLLLPAGATAAETASQPDGRFAFPPIAPRSYHLSASAQGFTEIRQAISLAMAQIW